MSYTQNDSPAFHLLPKKSALQGTPCFGGLDAQNVGWLLHENGHWDEHN